MIAIELLAPPVKLLFHLLYPDFSPLWDTASL